MIKSMRIPVFVALFAALMWYLSADTVPAHVDVAKLPVVDSFSSITGDGRTHMFIFESIDCAYCAKLQPELSKLRNTTVHILPLPGHSDKSKALAEAAWCAPDPAEAWRAAFAGVAPQNERCSGSALERNLARAKSMGFTVTPTIILGDGTVIQGYQTASQLQEKIRDVRLD
jgi:thiol:disulfide interchange protein DsbC